MNNLTKLNLKDNNVVNLNQLERGENDEKIIKNSCFNCSRKYFKEYCTHTSIHGFQYFGQNRTIFEKIFWTLIFTIILTVCSLAVHNMYKKWDDSPIIVTFATKDIPIYKIPFPAVTICPSAKVAAHCNMNYAKVALKKEENETLTPHEKRFYDYTTPLCDRPEDYEEDGEIINDGIYVLTENKTFTEEFYDFLHKCNPLSKDLFVDLRWMGKYIKVNDGLQEIITDEGICYSFNMLDRNAIFKDNVKHFKHFHLNNETVEWETQSQYFPNASLKTYPRRALLSGASNTLEIKIALNLQETDYRCKGIHQGYKIVVHIPSRIPRPSEEFVIIPFNQASMITVDPRLVMTSDRIKNYTPSQRSCFFPGEKFLKFFKLYTRKNCNLECITNYTLASCGCVSFYMPRENSTPICGAGSLQCVNNALVDFKMSKLYNKLESDKGRKVTSKGICDCLTLCTDITYKMDVTQVPWDWEKHANEFGEEGWYKEEDWYDENITLTSISIFFNSNDIVTLERNELYGPMDFVSSLGGLLGLFTGFSVLSLMEIIYFITVRLIGNIRIFGNWYETR